jgi:hypothetical protein
MDKTPVMRHKQLKKNLNASNKVSDTKLFEVLKHFGVYELNRLRKFVESPYFNRNEILSSLLSEIDQIIRKGTSDHISKEQLWAIVIRKQPYNDIRFRKHCSDLLKLTERFLMQEMFENNTLQKADNLLVAIYNRKLEPLYNSSLASATRLSEQYHFRPASYYYYEYAFERNFYNLAGLEIERTKAANIEQMADSLDKFYVAEKLRCYCIMVDRQRVASHDYRVLFIDEIIAHIEAGNLRDVVPINLYYQIYLTQEERDEPAHFEELKKLLEMHLPRLPQMEAFEILDSALNYCVNQVNSGKNNYLREYMELSLMGIQNEVLLVNGALSPWTFRNIVFAGLRLKDYSWVESFIDGYHHQIDEQYRENAVSFNLANLYFYQRKFDDLLKLLQSVEYEDPSYSRNSKIMLLLTYYELEEIESLTSLLSSFELYLRRNRAMPENRKTPYLNLIKSLRSLTRIPNTESAALLKLRKRIESTESIVNKEWLLEKIDELLD